jgi:hypothetical protein
MIHLILLQISKKILSFSLFQFSKDTLTRIPQTLKLVGGTFDPLLQMPKSNLQLFSALMIIHHLAFFDTACRLRFGFGKPSESRGGVIGMGVKGPRMDGSDGLSGAFWVGL